MDQENNDARNDEIARLAAEGIPHAELAVRFGISRQRIGQIAARGKEPQSERVTQLRSKYSELQRIVNRPPAKTTAIGKTVTDPDSGETIRDMSVTVQASREQRMLLSELRREEELQRSTQADDAEQERLYAEFWEYFTSTVAERDRLTMEVADLRNRLSAYESDAGEIVWPAEIVS